MLKKNKIYRMILAAMFLALALVLPFLTGEIPQIGKMLCPMHIPVLLCGFFCGPWYALFVGFIAPLLRLALFGVPVFIPTGAGMCFELATYGFAAGVLYRLFPRKKVYIYAALIGAMLCGRIVWALARLALYGLLGSEFSWAIFVSGGFVKAIPGIIVQLVLIPILVMVLERSAGNQPTPGSID